MAHKPGHPDKKMKSFMDSLNIKNKAIKYMAELKKIDSLMSRGPGGMPYYIVKTLTTQKKVRNE
jgi:hypothetical protein